MKPRNIFLLICAFMLLSISTQVRSANRKQDGANNNDKVVITGTVTDKMGNRIKGAPVEVFDNSNTYTLTDQNGYYSITALPGSQIRISYIGYRPDTLTVTESATINVKLYTEDDLKPATKNKNFKGNWMIGGGVGISTGF